MQTRISQASSLLLGFSIASAAIPRTAHAYYAAGWVLITGATSLGGTTTGLGVYLTVRAGQGGGGKDARGSARDMIDGLVLDARGEIGVQARVLTQSPSAFAQLTHEARRGYGPAIDTLAAATNVPRERVAAVWMEAVDASGGVSDESSAMRVTQAFFERLAPELEPRSEDLADVALALVREAQDRQPAESRQHVAFARALGVDAEVVAAATRDAVIRIGGAPDDVPSVIVAHPGAFADALAEAVAERAPDAVMARAQEYRALPS